MAAVTARGQGPTSDATLAPKGAPLTRSISGGQRHLYEVPVSAGEMVRLRIVRRGIALTLTFARPDGSALVTIDKPDANATEDLAFVAQETGVHRIEVAPRYDAAETGSYEIALVDRRPAEPRDREEALADANDARVSVLQTARTEEALRAAIVEGEGAATRRRLLGTDEALAATLDPLGMSYLVSGDTVNARRVWVEARAAARRAGATAVEAMVSVHEGSERNQGGNAAGALDLFREGVRLAQAAGDVRAEAEAELSLGLSYDLLRDHQSSLDHARRALQLARSGHEADLEAYLQMSIGRVYANLGHNRRSLEHLERAVVEMAATRQSPASALAQLGATLAQLRRWDEALPHLEEALRLGRRSGSRIVEVSVLAQIARGRLAKGDADGAAERLVTACELAVLWELPYPAANYLRLLADAEAARGQLDQAAALYQAAVEAARDLKEPLFEASALLGLAEVAEKRGALVEAAARTEAALRLLETTRAAPAEASARATFLGYARKTYELAVRVAMRRHEQRPAEGHDRTALELSERAHARALLDELAPDPPKPDQALAARARDLRRAIEAAREKPEPKAGAEIRRLLSEEETVWAETRRRQGTDAAPIEPVGLEGVQHLLDDDTLLLEYLLGPDTSYVFAVSSGDFLAAELPGRKAIDAQVLEVRRLATARKDRVAFETREERAARWTRADSDYDSAARELSRMLLGPVASRLGRRRIVVVADGGIHYVPFSALPVPAAAARTGAPPTRTAVPLLLDDHDVVTLPSASVLRGIRARAGRQHRPPSKTIAVLADPVFDANDPRMRRPQAPASGTAVKPAAQGAAGSSLRALENGDLRAAILRSSGAAEIARLPSTRREAESILALVPRAASRAAIGFDASREMALSPMLGDYRIVHFATHGYVDASDPRLSGLVLSLVDSRGAPQDGFLVPSDVDHMTLNADLVTLSACETALGEEIDGEGLLGLTRSFLNAGTQRVLSTLWRVDDDATASLMETFYRGILREGLPPGEALSRAQRAVRKNPRWRAPFYWAGFSLEGEPL
jgi:CHAT domain-containing protein